MNANTSVLSILVNLKNIGCRVWLDNGKVKVRTGKDGISDELKAQLMQQKDQIKAFLSQKAQDSLPDWSIIQPQPADQHLVLSFAQQRLWFLAQLEGPNATYNMPLAFELKGQLNIDALERALGLLVERQQCLRLNFSELDGEATVQLCPSYNPLTITDVSHLTTADGLSNAIQKLVDAHANQCFDLAGGPLFNIELLTLTEDHSILLFNMHHIISDGWSMDVLTREWVNSYNALSRGKNPNIEPLELQYSDYAAWQRSWLQGEVLQGQIDYWKQQLQGAPQLLSLPTDKPRPANQSYRGARLISQLDPQLVAPLKKLSQQADCTLFMTLLSAFGILLQRYSAADDILIGSPIANRTQSQIEGLVGFFVNTIVLRTCPRENLSFSELLQQVRQTSLDAYAHQDVPFEYLVEQLNPQRSTGHSPLYQVMFAGQNNPNVALNLADLDIQSLAQDFPTAKVDLSLHAFYEDQHINLMWEYATDLFLPERIERMSGHFAQLLQQIVSNPNAAINSYRLLGEAENQQLQHWSHSGQRNNPIYPSIVEQFQTQVAQTPDNTALVFEDQQLSYLELNQKANRLTHQLKPITPDTLVGICVERSVDMIIGLLAILKAGGAYVPLDPKNPEKRLRHIIEDCQLRLILTQTALKPSLPETAAQLICLDQSSEIETQTNHNPEPVNSAQDLAYVMYTSGSTGKPKGVCVPHQAVVSLVKAADFATFDDRQTFLQYASYAFDASTLEIWGALLSGAKLVVMPPQDKTLDALANVLQQQKISVLWLTSSLFNVMVDEYPHALKQVKQLLTGGETLSQPHVQKALQLLPDTQLINGYGPTENTTFTCCYPIEQRQYHDSIPIGKPINGAQVFIVDKNNQPLPIGYAGELVTGGAGLAQGYLNEPQLSAEKFVDIELFGKKQRVYKTGDLARWLPDGNLEFLGRSDKQVKLRGFRIELGEIERTLAHHNGVQDNVVLCAQDEHTQDKQLLAYVVADQQQSGDGLQDASEQVVSDWVEIFDTEYQGQSEDDTFNLSGWTSSYTGEPIPAPEMQQWVDNTVAGICALKPKSLLEIGCGTGLLLSRVAPHCQTYWGTDFSATVLQKVAQLKQREPLNHVQLHQCVADDFSKVEQNQFDTIVLNSVVQYFPSVAYLMTVLEQAIENIKPGGHLFVGDIRHFGLLNAFHTSVQSYQDGGDTSAEDFQQKVLQRQQKDKELLVHPHLFLALQQLNPRVTGVTIRPHQGAAHNELTRFRYQAILQIGDGEAVPTGDAIKIDWHNWSETQFSAEQLRQHLEAEAPPLFALRNVANARLHDGVDPHALWQLADDLPYDVELSWAQGDPQGHFDVLFKQHDQSARLPQPVITPRAWTHYANNPQHQQLSEQLVPQLREHLNEALPEHMCPAHFIFVDKLPLTANGKVDRKALSLIRPDTDVFAGTIIAPRSESQTLLASLWSDVLNIEVNSITANFFDLGGHSLLATRLVSRIRDSFNLEMPLRTLFDHPRLDELAEWIEQQQRGNTLPSIEAQPADQPQVLSHAQQRLWFLAQLEGPSATYNMPMAHELKGPLNIDALENTLTMLVTRQQSLRLTFPEVDGKACVREIPAYNPLTISHLGEHATTIQQRINEHANQCFDLAQGPLFSIDLLILNDNHSVLLFNIHHIISDGWSMDVLLREWVEIYDTLSQNQGQGQQPKLIPLPIQYSDYSSWQRNWLQGEVLQGQLDYWQKQLQGAPALLALPTDSPRPATQSYRGAHLFSQLDSQLMQSLQNLSKQQGCTLFMTLLSAFNVLLYRYTDQSDIPIGSPIANRTQSKVENLVGFFVNTLVLRTPIGQNSSFSNLLKTVRQTTLDAYAHQDIPFEYLVEQINPQRSTNHNPLFQVMFAGQNNRQSGFNLAELDVKPQALAFPTTKFDLSLHAFYHDDHIQLMWEYATDLFNPQRIERMSEHFCRLLQQIVSNPDADIHSYQLLSEAENRQLMQWSHQHNNPIYPSIVEQFQTQVAQTPDNTALVFEGQQLSYLELNQKANRLAHQLKPITPDTLVGICVERSVDMIVGLLAILKAGGAYVPLDPKNPEKRLRHIIEDCQLRLILTQTALKSSLPETAAQLICLDQSSEIETQADHNPEPVNSVQDLAYVMYTSGSTGKPKGVCVPHQAVVSLVKDADFATFDDRQTFLQYAPYAFDASTFEIWGALLNGAKLVVMPPQDKTLDALANVLQQQKVSVLWLTSSLFNVMVDVYPHALKQVKQLLTGGETLSQPHVQKALKLLPDTQLINGYGPTENTTFTCCYPIEQRQYHDSIPIGKPINGAQVFIVDKNNQPLPIGYAGELVTGGAGLAQGYLNEPQLSAEKFVDIELFGKKQRVYKTGDLVRWLPDGNLEFLGRSDKQVKLRGFRIELGEIERTLAHHNGVQDNVVLCAQDEHTQDKQLLAYVVADQQQSGDGLQDASEQVVSDWVEIFDTEYQGQSENDTFNLSGWTSSYTGEPIPAPEMQQWVDNTVASICALKPKSLLEIGCGTGLLLSRVAPHCQTYWGTDFSATVLQKVAQLKQREPLNHVQLHQCVADDFSKVEQNQFDTIVLNSVVQYFPSVAYLMTVLEQAIENIKPGGHLFVGDIRHFGLLNAFHTSVQSYQDGGDTSAEDFQQKVLQRQQKDKELLVHPHLFLALQQLNPRVTGVTIRPHQGAAHNELTRFRYQAILQIGDGETAPTEDAIKIDWHNWSETQWGPEQLRQHLEAEAPPRFALRNVANARLHDGVDPHALWQLADDLPYDVELSWAQGDPQGHFDVLFKQRGQSGCLPQPVITPRAWMHYANNPQHQQLSEQLVPQLREHITEALPEHMCPAHFIFVDKLPLTPNGKVDRKALSLIRPDTDVFAGTIIAPRSESQTLLASLWSDVLNIEVNSITANFFDLGGHSLLATRLVSRIRDSFNLEMPLRTLFDHPRLDELAEWIEQQQRGNTLPSIEAQPADQPLVLSHAQQRLWFLAQLEGPSATYNMPMAHELKGPLNIDALENTLKMLVARQQSLRLTFPEVHGQACVQEIPTYNPLTIHHLGDLAEDERTTAIQQRINEHANQCFDLAQGPLFSIDLLILNDNHSVLLFNIHHIISDGWSMDVLLREWVELYDTLSQGQQPKLTPLPIQYSDYSSWQRNWLQGEVLQNQLDYWQKQLQGAPALLALPTESPRPATQSYRGAHLFSQLDSQLMQSLQNLSKQQGCTLFMTLLSAFNVLLYRYTDQSDIPIGSPIANRTQSKVENLVGFFVNTLVLRTPIGQNASFSNLLKTVRQTTLDAYAHQDIPFEYLVEQINPQRSTNHNPLFQVMFAGQNNRQSGFNLAELEVKARAQEFPTTKFDLSLHAFYHDDHIQLMWEYATDLFAPQRIERMSEHFKALLQQIVNNPDADIHSYHLLGEAENQQLMQWSHHDQQLARPIKTIVEQFQTQVNKTPNNTALVFEGQQLSYQQLNQKANRLAHQLKPIKPDTLVGICVERSVDMITGLLAILKAGGAYVPLDPKNPEQRLRHIMEDCQLGLILTQTALKSSLPETAAQLICLDQSSEIDTQADHNPEPVNNTQDLAYVMYTSGSTGKPKGVCVPHQAVVSLVKAADFATFDDRQTFLQYAPYAFDASTLEIWGALLSGAKLVVMPPQDKTLDALANVLQQQKISVLWLTSSLFNVMVDEYPHALKQVKQLLTGGEALSQPHVQKALQLLPDTQLINGYGPTENTTFTCCYPIEQRQYHDSIPIGRPINGAQVFIVDKNNQPLPIGYVGELVTGGAGLARGYLNQPQLSAERFVDIELFGTKQWVYKTGDLARWLPDGNLAFLGRADKQVKLRGFRIELGEIERTLAQHPSIQDNALLCNRNTNTGDSQLLAYVVADQQQNSDDLQDTSEQVVSDWVEIFDSEYQDQSEDDTFNLSGWTSSYTGQPIPAPEMQQWVDNTVASICALKPKSLLEIGCGTGLLLSRVAPHCQTYWGTDFSATVLQKVAQLKQREPLNHVQLHQCVADDFSKVEQDQFDTIVLNSVVQYFPSVAYLMTVLEQAIAAIKPGGHLFVGDIRHFGLLSTFHASVLSRQVAGERVSREDFQQKVMQRQSHDKELLLDPQLFVALQQLNPRVKSVSIRPHLGAAHNELTRFRYQVVLQIGETQEQNPALDVTPVDWLNWSETPLTPEQLGQRLEGEAPAVFAVRNIANARLAHDNAVVQWMGSDSAQNHDVLQQKLAAQPLAGLDPQTLYQLAQDSGYDIELSWAQADSQGRFDVMFKKQGHPAALNARLGQPVLTTKAWTHYANNPQQQQLNQQLVPQLRDYLSQRLPDHMLPSHFMFIDKLPLTNNGKIDEIALGRLTPEQDSLAATQIIIPSTESEIQLAKLWSSLLQIDVNSTQANFFDLGGHSLLATRLVSRIRDHFGINLPLKTCFNTPMLGDLAQHIDAQQSLVANDPLQFEEQFEL